MPADTASQIRSNAKASGEPLWRLPTPLLNQLQHGEYVPSVQSSTRWKCTKILDTLRPAVGSDQIGYPKVGDPMKTNAHAQSAMVIAEIGTASIHLDVRSIMVKI
jgi:hypothetical protein